MLHKKGIKTMEIKDCLKFLFLNVSSTSKLKDVHFNPSNTNIMCVFMASLHIINKDSGHAKTVQLRIIY